MKGKKFDKWCLIHKDSIAAIGVIVTIFVLVMSVVSVIYVHTELQLALKQDREQHKPIWKWEINKETNKISLSAINEGVAFPQIANIVFPSVVDSDSIGIPLDWATKSGSLQQIVFSIARLYENQNDNNKDVVTVIEDAIPFVACISYLQYGSLSLDYPIYALRYLVIIDNGIANVELDGVSKCGQITDISENGQAQKFVDAYYKSILEYKNKTNNL